MIEKEFARVQQNPKQVLGAFFRRGRRFEPFERLFAFLRSGWMRHGGQVKLVDNFGQGCLTFEKLFDAPRGRSNLTVEKIAVEQVHGLGDVGLTAALAFAAHFASRSAEGIEKE